jgi:hypothetical protein
MGYKPIINNIDYDKIYHAETGDFKIIEFLGYNKEKQQKYVKVKFLETGTEIIAEYYNAMKCNVKDRYAKVVLGVACLGNATCTGENKKAYTAWFHMISRCYDPRDSMYSSYGAVGVRVSDEWLCFENFVNNIKFLPGYNEWVNDTERIYQLDKDTLQVNVPNHERIYSKETCCFIPQIDNIIRRSRDKKLYGNPHTQYYGVIKSGNNFQVYITVNGVNMCFGTYYTAEAAATVYDYYAWLYNKPLINGNTGMDIANALKYRTNYNPYFYKEMCVII